MGVMRPLPGKTWSRMMIPTPSPTPRAWAFRHVPEIVVSELMGQHTPKLVIAGLLQKTARHIELSAARACRIDVRIVHDPHLDLTQGSGMVHGGHERGHDAADPLRLLRVEWTRRRLACPRRCRRGSARRRAGYAGATRGKEAAKEEDDEAAAREHGGLESGQERGDARRETPGKGIRHRSGHGRAS